MKLWEKIKNFLEPTTEIPSGAYSGPMPAALDHENGPELFRKLPVHVYVMRYYKDNLAQLIDWISNSGGQTALIDGDLHICTLEGMMKATPGDYIIQGVKGEFYPCKPDIFWGTYTKEN